MPPSVTKQIIEKVPNNKSSIDTCWIDNALKQMISRVIFKKLLEPWSVRRHLLIQDFVFWKAMFECIVLIQILSFLTIKLKIFHFQRNYHPPSVYITMLQSPVNLSSWHPFHPCFSTTVTVMLETTLTRRITISIE